jgi:glutamate synthase domain-containing protein 1
MTCINNTEKNDLIIESKSNEQTSSLFDEVMQAFTDIYSETDSTSFDMTGK